MTPAEAFSLGVEAGRIIRELQIATAAMDELAGHADRLKGLIHRARSLGIKIEDDAFDAFLPKAILSVLSVTSCNTMSDNSTKFEQWALVELMGHQRIAGLVSEQNISGTAFLRVDVPNLNGQGFAFTRFYSAAAVYCISPSDKQIATGLAAKCASRPVSIYDL